MKRSVARSAVLALVVSAALAPGAADSGARPRDTVWQHPDSAVFAIHAIAMFPPASYDRNARAEKLADQMWGAQLRGSGHRWVSSTSTRALVAAGPAGDSLAKAASDRLLELGRVDSLHAPELCRRARTGAMLSLRVDRWEQLQMEFNQAGKPSTTIGLTASLVDSTGRLLWSISGTETAEGPYHDPNAGVLGVKTSGLSNQPVTGQGGAPDPLEVVATIVQRWRPRFPAKTASAAGE
jgi:hypothetical protein